MENKMEKNIEEKIKKLTSTSRNISLQELCDYINNECYKEFKRMYYFNVDNIIDENWHYETENSLEMNGIIYEINKCNIEISEVGKIPLIIEFYYIDVLDENDKSINNYLFI